MRVLVLLLGLLVQGHVFAAERIEHFQSDVQVRSDGSMEVIETITVQAEGDKIRRGIYRDFPTTYRDRFNNRRQVRFEVVGVRRDGKREPWFTKSMSNGVRIYAGDKNVTIPRGRHTYEFIYRTNRQLGFFNDHDELYWNVTGNDWAFPIEQAVAYVYLPKSVPAAQMDVEAYTGRQGATGSDFTAGIDDDGVAWFRTTRRLSPGEGLTLVTSWPKGHVRAPTSRQEVEWFLEDNGHLLAAIVGGLLLLGYYLVVWSLAGRDPAAGIVFPRYEPPKRYSPAAMRFVEKMGYDPRCFTAALVNLAAKGHVRIDVQSDNSYRVTRDESSQPMAPGEKVLRDRLLVGQSIEVKRSNHQTLRKAMDAHKLRLEADYERIYFMKNIGLTAVGIVISVLVLGAALLWSPSVEELAGAGFIMVWLTGWSFGVYALVTKAVQAWRSANGVTGRIGATALTLFAIPFVGGWFMGAFMLSMAAGLATAVLLAGLVGINFLFYHLMKAPTAQGRRLLDEVEGFREYLALAEADELRLKNPPEKTPELFERFLPYAIALDLEDVWGRKFESVLAAARREHGYSGPSWYRGGRSFSPASLASSVGGNLAGSISSSSTAPGSSSGGGGGGSSGGGGGGGGGGGW